MRLWLALMIALSCRTACAETLDEWLARPCYPVFEPRPLTVKRTGYPVHAGMVYDVEGSLNPSREFLIRHLQTGQHYGKFDPAWLASLSYRELVSLHDDDHLHRLKVSISRPRQQVTTSCPNGMCPLPGRRR